MGATMSRGFQRVFDEVVRAARRADRPVASPQSAGHRSASLEWQIRKRALLGDRIVFCLGFALAVSSASFLVYAVKASEQLPPITLRLPKFAPNYTVDQASLAPQRSMNAEDPETTGALPPSTRATNSGGTHDASAQQDSVTGLHAYTIRRAFQGFATLDGPDGSRDVVPGVEVPGAGTVLSVSRVAGQWVVETSEGFIRSASR